MVETTNAAQACVELLRRENLGVATFMILVLMHATVVCNIGNSYCIIAKFLPVLEISYTSLKVNWIV